MRDRNKAFVHHLTNEWMSINGDVKTIMEIKHNTRRKSKTTTNIFFTQNNQKNKRNIVRKNCFENAKLSQMDIVEDVS